MLATGNWKLKYIENKIKGLPFTTQKSHFQDVTSIKTLPSILFYVEQAESPNTTTPGLTNERQMAKNSKCLSHILSSDGATPLYTSGV